eukprot:CAMPEP_0181318002 /NCGR_PEP_ID=MMETSP1101-20121128/16772_1 /TAXON_ID=46948 /ORGANISM="Rhodomonas abbreviata, Strain Caron Lab Isolate" /LENGTH=251 /DNA_ID=CAMNT_0023425439 /DNA_START=66 /DNA_END=821 /DNA_ORIENTATION=-
MTQDARLGFQSFEGGHQSSMYLQTSGVGHTQAMTLPSNDHMASAMFTPSSPSTSESNCPSPIVVRPRRRDTSRSSTLCDPVTLTKEVLEALYCKPLADAAKTIGISVTAFKKACRMFGIRNWPYRFQDVLAASRGTEQPSSPVRQPSTNAKDIGIPAQILECSQPFLEYSAVKKHGLLTHSESSVSLCPSDLSDSTVEQDDKLSFRPEELFLLAQSQRLWGGEAGDMRKTDARISAPGLHEFIEENNSWLW